VLSNGESRIVLPDEVVALNGQGHVAERWPLSGPAFASLASNDVLLLAGGQLTAITKEGRHLDLWSPPAPLVTPPVLAGGLLHVATDEPLFALEGLPERQGLGP